MDSRLKTLMLVLQLQTCFWGIVWTAGSEEFYYYSGKVMGFWGIVWTAG